MFVPTVLVLLSLLAAAVAQQCPNTGSSAPISCYNGFSIHLPPGEIICDCRCGSTSATATDSSSTGGGESNWMAGVVGAQADCNQAYCSSKYPICSNARAIIPSFMTGAQFNLLIESMPEAAATPSPFPAGTVCIKQTITVTQAALDNPDFFPPSFDAGFMLGATVVAYDGGSPSDCRAYVSAAASLGPDAVTFACKTNLCNVPSASSPPLPAGSPPLPAGSPTSTPPSTGGGNNTVAAVASVIAVALAIAVGVLLYQRRRAAQAANGYSSMYSTGTEMTSKYVGP